jgi:hypothetical protein
MTYNDLKMTRVLSQIEGQTDYAAVEALRRGNTWRFAPTFLRRKIGVNLHHGNCVDSMVRLCHWIFRGFETGRPECILCLLLHTAIVAYLKLLGRPKLPSTFAFLLVVLTYYQQSSSVQIRNVCQHRCLHQHIDSTGGTALAALQLL